MLNRARAAVLIVAALTLASCGSIHPGDAAVVDDHSISMTKFDKTARIYCKLTLLSAQEQGMASVPNADVRRQTISDLVTIYVARDLAKEKGVSVDKKQYELSGDQVKEVGTAFPKGDDAEHVEFAIENSQEIAAIAVALAEKSTGVTATNENSSQLAEAGHAAIIAAFKDHDVKFAPRFGLSSSLKELGPTGSLSVPETDGPAEDQLPADQRCA
ncbi:hypothetical protein J2X11_000942 [Aeromicrobium panaciterrae]|uniref:Lipoprotein n=1 Tax=Aeromicrobium panaciterrae TaxID=363861 RepID=A0ABU1ULN8_9ACTN|nr:hypothetical protein [Aeromicrobium panaciterrae]MDR7086103.1 hypothetical protein [Aeromicrobium panaciterrae]